jgi:Mg2+ and Co2+ transporter CorA
MAAKLSTIGGGGGNFDRDKSPFNYWSGVWFTAALMFVMILVLIGSFVQPDRFHLD